MDVLMCGTCYNEWGCMELSLEVDEKNVTLECENHDGDSWSLVREKKDFLIGILKTMGKEEREEFRIMADTKIWDEFDKQFDTEELQKGVAEAKENGGYEEVPHGTYIVGVDKMELVKSKNGHPMVSIWFTIKEGQFKNSKVFYNQVINNPFGIHNNNNLLIDMQLECVDEVGSELFKTYGQYGQLLLDAAEEIDEYGLTFELEYGAGKNDFNTFKITDVFE